MRGLIIVLLLSILLIVGIVFNFHYVHSLYQELYESINKLNISPSEENNSIIESIKETWQTKSKWLCISLGYHERTEISNAIDQAIISNQEGSNFDFQFSIASLKNSLENIIRLERLSFNNIF